MSTEDTDTQKAAAFAPLASMGKTDADKLIDYASALMHLPPPEMGTQAGAEAMRQICKQVFQVARAAQDKAGEL